MNVRLRAGKYMIPATLEFTDGRIFIEFPFNRDLMAEIKSMQGHKYHGYDEVNPRKIWSVANSQRNIFQLSYLMGKNPYEQFDKELIDFVSSRPLYKHQLEMVRHCLTRHYCILACEMGTGKSLVFIEAMEYANVSNDECWYIGPKAGVEAVDRELYKWKSKVQPVMMTYQRLVKVMKEPSLINPIPKFVCFDESSKLKNHASQQSKASLELSNLVRETHGQNGYIILMSGTPAPKAPTDWWHQCEVAQPGFLKEGDPHKFKARLCLIEQRQSITGGTYPHIVTWLNDANKCKKCGQTADMHIDHPWEPSVNEVEGLNRRLKGLVLVRFKKDCVDLPDKQYKIIKCKPTVDQLLAFSTIKKTARRAIEALTLSRELSDGFQYTEVQDGVIKCPNCHGKGEAVVKISTTSKVATADIVQADYEDMLLPCDICGGTGEVAKMSRGALEIGTPKDEAFINLLDEHEDIGRFVVYAGFTGTIDRLCAIAKNQGWWIIRVDGRPYKAEMPDGTHVDYKELLSAMDAGRKDLLEKYPKVCFIGHPQAGGYALTLTASPTLLFYSNSYHGESRFQAEDRIHRIGMDTNRGATIIDLVCLPIDSLVIKNLREKKRLQDLTMGQILESFQEVG